MAAPPCTDFTVSGAQYWREKDRNGKTEKSIRLVKKPLEIIEYFNPVFWALENPVVRLQELVPEIGEPWYFQPYEFGDPWSKKTGLWGNFNKPKKAPVAPKRFSAQGSWTQSLGSSSEETKRNKKYNGSAFCEGIKANSKTKNKSSMKLIEHRDFIAENAVDIKILPEGLQKKLSLFNKMLEKLNDTIDEDNKILSSKLKELDGELVGDLETEFEDQLENNDIDHQNDDILESLYKKGKTVQLKSELERAGFKGDLTDDFIPVGNYCLQRIASFTYKFKIHKLSK